MARANKTLTFSDPGNRAPGITGRVELSLTASAATTSVVNIKGLAVGRIQNLSGEDLSITFQDAISAEGTAMDLKDNAGAAVSALTILDGESHALPNAILGCEFLVIINDATVASGVYLTMFR